MSWVCSWHLVGRSQRRCLTIPQCAEPPLTAKHGAAQNSRSATVTEVVPGPVQISPREPWKPKQSLPSSIITISYLFLIILKNTATGSPVKAQLLVGPVTSVGIARCGPLHWSFCIGSSIRESLHLPPLSAHHRSHTGQRAPETQVCMMSSMGQRIALWENPGTLLWPVLSEPFLSLCIDPLGFPGN